MRAIFIAALMALGIGLAGTSPTSAAPANGAAIGNAADLQSGGRSGALALAPASPAPPALLVAPRPSPLQLVVSIAGIATRRAGRRTRPARSHLIRRRPHLRPSPQHRGDEARARIGKAEPARLEHVTHQEEAGQREAVGDILRRRIVRDPRRRGTPAAAAACPSTARRPAATPHVPISATHRRDRSRCRSPRSSRDRGRSRARRAAAARSAPRRGGETRIEQAVEHVLERDMNLRMRIALRQQAAERGEMGHAVERMRHRQERRRARIEALDRVEAEMLVEPRPPGGS